MFSSNVFAAAPQNNARYSCMYNFLTSKGNCPPLGGAAHKQLVLHAAHGANEQFFLHVKTEYHEEIPDQSKWGSLCAFTPVCFVCEDKLNCSKALLAGAIRAQKTSIPTPQNTYPGLLATHQGRAPTGPTGLLFEGVRYLVLCPAPCKAGVRLPQGWIVLPGGTPESRIPKRFYACFPPPPSTRPTGSLNRNQCALRHKYGSEWRKLILSTRDARKGCSMPIPLPQYANKAIRHTTGIAAMYTPNSKLVAGISREHAAAVLLFGHLRCCDFCGG
eukprot:gene21256-biopygen5654